MSTHKVDWVEPSDKEAPIMGLGPVWAYGAYEFSKATYRVGAVHAKYNGRDWYTWNTNTKMLFVTHWASTTTPEPPSSSARPGTMIEVLD